MKIIKNTIKLFILLYSFNAISLDNVSDLRSYGYYVEQLKEAARQLKEMQKQVNETKKLNTSFDSYLDDLREKFDFTTQIKQSLDKQLKEYQRYARNLSRKDNYRLDFHRKYDPKDIDLRDIIDQNLDGIYVDPDDSDFHTKKIKKLRNMERQRLLRDGLVKTEEKLVAVQGNFDRLEELHTKATKTKTLKEALHLNNVILIEILAGINNMVDIMSTLGQAEMAAKYIHYNKEKHEAELQAAKKEKAKYNNQFGSKSNKKIKYVYRGGKKMTKDEAYEQNKKCLAYKREHGHTDIQKDGADCPDRSKREFRKLIDPKYRKTWE